METLETEQTQLSEKEGPGVLGGSGLGRVAGGRGECGREGMGEVLPSKVVGKKMLLPEATGGRKGGLGSALHGAIRSGQ